MKNLNSSSCNNINNILSPSTKKILFSQKNQRIQYNNKNFSILKQSHSQNAKQLNLIINSSNIRDNKYTLLSPSLLGTYIFPKKNPQSKTHSKNSFINQIKPLSLINERNFSNMSIKRKHSPNEETLNIEPIYNNRINVLNRCNSNLGENNILKSNKINKNSFEENYPELIFYENLCNNLTYQNIYTCAEYIIIKLKNKNYNVPPPNCMIHNPILKQILEKVYKTMEVIKNKYNKTSNIEKVYSLLQKELQNFKKNLSKKKKVYEITSKKEESDSGVSNEEHQSDKIKVEVKDEGTQTIQSEEELKNRNYLIKHKKPHLSDGQICEKELPSIHIFNGKTHLFLKGKIKNHLVNKE